jgi:hypothetical protein
VELAVVVVVLVMVLVEQLTLAVAVAEAAFQVDLLPMVDQALLSCVIHQQEQLQSVQG